MTLKRNPEKMYRKPVIRTHFDWFPDYKEFLITDSIRNFDIRPKPLLSIESVGIHALPIPGIPAHVVLIVGGFPTQNLPALGRVCVAGGQVTGTAGSDLVGNWDAVGGFKGLYHVQHGVAVPVPRLKKLSPLDAIRWEMAAT